MKVTPVNAPVSTPTIGATQAQTDARSRAIAMLSGQTQGQQTTPVANSNNISPEEVGAIKSGVQTQENADESTTIESQGEESQEETQTTIPEAELQSKQLAALVRREKAIRAKQTQQEAAIKSREDALAAREAQLASKASTFDQSKYISKDKFKQSPLEVMAEAGLSYDEIVQQMVNQTPLDPRLTAQINKLEAEIQRLNEANENSTKNQQSQQQQAYDAAVRQIKMDAESLVDSNPEYETIKATNSIDDVVELIKQTYEKDGVLMSVEEAALEVENYLIEEAMKLTSIGKIKKRLETASTAALKSNKQTPPLNQPKQPQPMKTLTNATGSSAQLSARERALLAFKGEKF